MNPEQARAVLETKRARILAMQGALREGEDASLGDRRPDPLDRGSDEGEAHRLDLLAQNEVRQLVRIDQALERVEKGDWGRCVSCGAPIEPRRLEVMPEAALCLDCQSAGAEVLLEEGAA